MITQEHLDEWFRFHSPEPEWFEKFAAVRTAGKELAATILKETPPSADQSAAIRKVREAVMTANVSIVCGGK
jgi:hypothetical protein